MRLATAHRIMRGIAVGVATLLVLVVAALLFFHTSFGRDRLRALLVDRLNGEIHGRLSIGRLGGDLPGEVVLHDVVLRDSAGAPVLAVRRLAARIHVLKLFTKRIDIAQMTLEQPVLLLHHERGGAWNVARVFARPHQGGSRSGGDGSGFGHWVRIANARVIGGDVTVRVPWSADSGLAPARRDSAEAAALAGATRARVVRDRDGFEQIMEFHRIDATLPRVLLAHPDSARIVVDVAKASMLAEPFRPPVADVRDLGGMLTITSDSLHFAGWRVVFPETRMAVDVRYAPGTGALAASLRAEPLVLDDLRWLHPALPSDGSGAIALEATRPPGGNVDVRGTRITLHSGATQVMGTVGFTLGAVPRLHDTDLTIEQLSTELIERLAPGVDLPFAGTIDARGSVEGPLTALRTDARVAVREPSGATSVVRARGTVQAEPVAGAHDLRVQVEPLRTSLVRDIASSFPLHGVVSGAITVSGTTASGWRLDGDLSHIDGGTRSRVAGTGRIGARAESFAVDARVAPLSLAALGQSSRSLRELGLHGRASGSVRASGTPDSATFRTSLRLADGGALEANGAARRIRGRVGYDVTVRPRALDPRSLSTRLPSGTLTGTIAARGTGTDLRTMHAEVFATLGHARLDRAEVDSIEVRGRVADGLASIDTAAVWVPNARLAAAGSIGLVAERRGALRYALHADSIQSLMRLARSFRGHARESDRGQPLDSVSGALTTSGVLTGNLDTLRAEGRVTARDMRGGALAADRAAADYTADLRGGDTLALTAVLDSARVRQATYERAEVRFTGSRSAGAGELSVRQNDRVDYHVRAEFARDEAGTGWDEGPGTTVLLRELTMRLDSATWRTTAPATLAWHTETLRVDSLRLTRTDAGSLTVNGVLPFAGNGELTVRVADTPLHDVGVLVQSDLGIDGRVSLDARIHGTTAAPCATADARLAAVTVGSDSMPDVRVSLSYADASLTGRAELVSDSMPPLLRANATLPVNLALTGVTGARLAKDAPLRADIRADSVPLVMLPRREQVQVLGGWARGAIAVRGTVGAPDATGHLEVRDGSARVVQTGTLLHDVVAAARLASDSIVLDSLVGRAGGPVRAHGAIALAPAGARPVSATITARDVAVLDGAQGLMHADADLTVSGTLDTLLVSGRAELLHGYVERKGPGEQTLHVVASGDPGLFAIIDTSAVARRESEPPRARPDRSVRLDLAVRIDSGVWYRSPPNANVEVATPRDLHVGGDLAAGDLVNGGIVLTKGGIYVFRLRPFSIVRGAAILAGVADVSPALELNGEHEVWIAGRGVVPVRITVAGFPGDVRFALGDASALPAAPPDLTSYLSLGRAPLSLLQFEGSSISGLTTGGTSLTGALGALTRRQQVSPALGAILYQFAKGAHDVVGVQLYTAAPTDLPPALSESRYAGVRGTTVEAGYLLGTRSYVAARLRLAAVAPGVVFRHTFESGLQFRAGYEPRFLVGDPTFGRDQQGLIRGSLGAFLAREWGF